MRSMPMLCISAALPTATSFPSTVAVIPIPETCFPPVTCASVLPAYEQMDLAMGWLESDSAADTYLSSSSSDIPEGSTFTTENSPRVSVPVLSNTTADALDMASMCTLPFTSIPWREALPIPQKYVSGIESTSAQGQDTTRNTIPLYTHPSQSSGLMRDGITAIRAAHSTTTGV